MRIFAALVIAVVALFLIFSTSRALEYNPVRKCRQICWLSDGQEVALGDYWMGRTIDELGKESVDPDLLDSVERVARRLTPHSDRPDLPYRFCVVESSEVNAWAFPGGRILIARGMLDAMSNDAQLALILSHELGHVVGRHIEVRHLHSIAASAAAFFTGSPLVGHLLCLYDSRCQERQADQYALTLMRRAGYDLHTALNWFERLEGEGRSSDLLSTHPTGDARFKFLRDTV